MVGTKEVGEKNNSFLSEMLSKLLFYGSSTLPTPPITTRGSSESSMVDPNWVRKVF
jgi:hypothetical protein